MIQNRLLVLLTGLAATVYASSLPDIPKCKKSDSMLPMCFMLATDIMRPYLVKGIPDRNIPPIEPLLIPMVMLQQGTSAVNYKADLKDIKVYGLRNYQFKNVVLNIPKLMAAARIEVPSIQLVSDYKIKGRALVVPIQGNGIFRANLRGMNLMPPTALKLKAGLPVSFIKVVDLSSMISQTGSNVQADVMIAATLKKRKGEEYLYLKTVKSKLSVGQASANFENLFNGDPTLSRVTNDFVNQNAKDLIEEIKPAVEAVVSMLIEDIGNKVLKTTPYSALFLPEN